MIFGRAWKSETCGWILNSELEDSSGMTWFARADVEWTSTLNLAKLGVRCMCVCVCVSHDR